MTPADAKDWWLAAAALSTAFVSSAQAQDKATATPEKAGVVSAMTPGVTTASGNRVLYVGGDTYRGEKLVTDATGTLHLLFMDQSSMTLGPNSQVTIDEFVYDPNTKRGKIGVSLGAGLLRVVGGQISKNTETTVKTASGTIGIRGGIATAEVNGNNTNATFLFGQSMRVSDNSGNTSNITRPGFGSSLGSGGLGPTTRTDPNTLRTSLNRLGGDPGSSNAGGNPNPSPAPPGQLLSTGNGGNFQAPGNSLAADRLNTVTSTTLQNNPPTTDRPLNQTREAAQNTLRNILTTTNTNQS